MDYLKKYGLSDYEISHFEELLVEGGVDTVPFRYDSKKIMNILDMFTSIGVTNIYGILVTNPLLFFDTINNIKKRIDGYKNSNELARLLNEDASNLSLIGML